MNSIIKLYDMARRKALKKGRKRDADILLSTIVDLKKRKKKI